MSELEVKEFLSTLPKGEKIFYRSNPGNAGDALIASGAYKLFDHAGLEIELIEPSNFDATGKTVIYAGGGNLVGIYPQARNFFSKFHCRAGRFILLPHTVMKNEDLLKELGSNVTVFARERVSYEHLKKHAKNAQIFLDHDLALHLNAKDFLEQPMISLPGAIAKKLLYKYLNPEVSATVPHPKRMLQNSLFELRTATLGRPEIGNFFREDIEARGQERPEGNADLSRIYAYGTRNRDLTSYTTSRLLRYINNFSLVRTDRLHICIGAALLGKDVDFFPNSYFKCKAVYEYSLRSRFPKIKWMPG
jgi:exopolysaccharide biosynthesis predicted pyruvyltransferase EpsI